MAIQDTEIALKLAEIQADQKKILETLERFERVAETIAGQVEGFTAGGLSGMLSGLLGGNGG